MSEDLLNKLFAAVEAGDAEGIRAVYTPETEIWHNDGQPAQKVEENLQIIGKLSTVVKGLNFDVLRRAEVEGGWYQQHVLRGSLEGEEVGLDAAMYIAVSDGHVTRIEEYVDGHGVAARIGAALMAAEGQAAA